MLKQVMTVLGLAWIDPADRVEITPAGEAFLNADDPTVILSSQALKYQFWNPSVSSKTHQLVRLHPVPFLVRLMQAVDGQITGDEYILFVSKARNLDDIDVTARLIDEYRSLGDDERKEVVRQCKNFSISGLRRSSIYDTIILNRPYAYRMWKLSSLIEDGLEYGLRLKNGSLRGTARRFLDEYAHQGTYIEFADEKEFLAWMGDPAQHPIQETALEVYLNRGDLISASKLKKQLGASPSELKNFRKMMIDEKTLEDNIEANLPDFGARLGLILSLVGRQFSTTVGPIDLLAKDAKSGSFVVIELKRGRSADRVFGQLSRYMGWVKKNLAGGTPVIGVIVGSHIDEKLRAARHAHDSDVRLMEYESKMSINLV